MRGSNLKVDGSTFMILVKEKARAGASDEEILSLMEKVTEQEDVFFNDRDLLGLIVEVIKSGKQSAELPQKLCDLLPKNRGFFQEMRNHIPEMIYHGELEVPYHLVSTFTLPPQVWSLTLFYSVDFSQSRISVKNALSTNAQSRFASVVVYGVLRPPRLA